MRIRAIIQKKVKELFHNLGIDIKRISVAQDQTMRLIKIITTNDVNLIFDIGANSGQFGKELRKNGYSGKIVSFEPLSKQYEKLSNVAKNDKFWQIVPRCAVGDNDGNIEINIAGNSGASSSILEMLNTHINAAPNTRNIGSETVPIIKLDSISSQYISENDIIFIKIDTQGYEDQVITGGIETIKKAAVLQLELSLVELYQDQKLFSEMINKVKSLGFDLWGIDPAFIDSNTGRMLQVDAVFLRSK